jgi:hypothetical protein
MMKSHSAGAGRAARARAGDDGDLRHAAGLDVAVEDLP